ncbi:hypothetical protein TNCV_988961 [Trichonephila clavipes]|nr:hypothetical protein TNCV_988961 [Trichonephila clavipes]
MHHSIFSCIIRRRLQQNGMSARRSLLRLPLTGNHRCLRTNDVMAPRNGMKLCLLMNPDSSCNIMIVGFELSED